MKIAFLAASNSIHSIRWIQYFVDQGHSVTWISLAPASPEALDLLKKTSYYEISPSPLADITGKKAAFHLFSAVRKIKEILKKERPDVLHIHSAGTYGLVGMFSGFHPRIVTPWGSDILLTSSLVKKILIEYVVTTADFLTCDGENTAKALQEFGGDLEKISIIRFGVDVKKFESLVHVPAPDNIVRVLSLRNLEPVYNIETLIETAEIVHKENKNVRFQIAGDGSERQKLETCVQEKNLQSCVTLSGRYDPNTLPAMFGNSDIYVSTSLSDSGLSASTAEAMAAGLPAIVSDSGDNRAWVKEERGGFIFPCKDAKTLAEHILFLAAHPETRKEFGEYNQNVIMEKNNYWKEMEKVEKIYLENRK